MSGVIRRAKGAGRREHVHVRLTDEAVASSRHNEREVCECIVGEGRPILYLFRDMTWLGEQFSFP